MATKKCFKGVYTKFRKTIIMSGLTIFGIVFVLLWVWVIYCGWSAPMMEEQSDGSWKTIKPEKKFSDLFKKNK
jgi:hypothetical protein